MKQVFQQLHGKLDVCFDFTAAVCRMFLPREDNKDLVDWIELNPVCVYRFMWG